MIVKSKFDCNPLLNVRYVNTQETSLKALYICKLILPVALILHM